MATKLTLKLIRLLSNFSAILWMSVATQNKASSKGSIFLSKFSKVWPLLPFSFSPLWLLLARHCDQRSDFREFIYGYRAIKKSPSL